MTILSALALSLTACTTDIAPSDDDEQQPDQPDPVTCEQTRSYTGFAGQALEMDRPAIAAGADRMRLKPYAALAAEYARALGLTTVNTAFYASTFGRAPARWYLEPAAGANPIYAAFSLAYSACNQMTASRAELAAAPDATNADAACRDFARAAWHREATDDEAAACATFAVEKTKPTDPPAKRWAYACASVLTSSGFLAY